MSNPTTLLTLDPRYCVDTNVIVSFLRRSDDEHYGSDVFAPQWAHIERMIASNAIIAPRQVERELGKWIAHIDTMGLWLRRHSHMFRDMSSRQLEVAKAIVNRYPAYGSSVNFLGDLEVMTLAAAAGIAVVTMETAHAQASASRPKIPSICREFEIDCVTVPGLLRRERFGQI